MREEQWSDESIEALWHELADVPFIDGENDIVSDADWFIFKKGTERNEIWHWFDKMHSKGVHYLIYDYRKKGARA